MIGLFASLLVAAEPAPAAPCTPERAIRASVEEVSGGIARFAGRCVTVEGYGRGRALFAGAAGMYLAARHGVQANRYQLGIMAMDEENSPTSLEPGDYRVTGIATTCRALSDFLISRSAPEVLSMPSGYCHMRGGPVLVATSWTAGPGRVYERMVGEANRRRYGNIEQAPRSWALRLRPAASRYRQALLRGDPAELRQLHGLWPEGQDQSSDLVLRQLLDPASPFAELRRGGEPQLAIFLDFAPERRRLRGAGELPGAWFCYCRGRDCTGRWPISSIDTGAHPSRPYVCTAYDIPEAGDADASDRYSVFFDDGASVEPPPFAFHRQSESTRR